ncbi:hypothetical protein [Pontibacillus salipaludis]|uniref:WYL domain-containing protein n=1 Tax=Pontibacillus salipaludis TaxID=1697394 RepID=A0ABQ1Q3X1_9BACI|nr:hypothetical protein [Pontibacillus salipaludis]GGD12780.1 hypothetical protein GCM10011389_20420 [Pontibacillus salipaludis]
MEGMLVNAKQDRETLEMIYLSKDGRLSQRKVRIIRVGASFILAYCYHCKNLRKFNRSSILLIGPLRNKVG